MEVAEAPQIKLQLLARRANMASQEVCVFKDGSAIPVTPQVLELEAYACRNDLRVLWHNLVTELLLQQPDNPLDFMLQHLTKEKEARDKQASQS